MQMLNLPIAQMIFSNLTPQQTVLALRYLMAKSGLKDADNLLELVDQQGNTTVLDPTDSNGNAITNNEPVMPQEQPVQQPPLQNTDINGYIE